MGEIKEEVLGYVKGLDDDEGVRDIECGDMIGMGEKKGVLFWVCDEGYVGEGMKR